MMARVAGHVWSFDDLLAAAQEKLQQFDMCLERHLSKIFTCHDPPALNLGRPIPAEPLVRIPDECQNRSRHTGIGGVDREHQRYVALAFGNQVLRSIGAPGSAEGIVQRP